jgi:hypothetical protein
MKFKLPLDAGETGLGAVFYNGLEFLATACFTFGACGPLLRNRMLIAIIADYAYLRRERDGKFSIFRRANPIDGGPLRVGEIRRKEARRVWDRSSDLLLAVKADSCGLGLGGPRHPVNGLTDGSLAVKIARPHCGSVPGSSFPPHALFLYPGQAAFLLSAVGHKKTPTSLYLFTCMPSG